MEEIIKLVTRDRFTRSNTPNNGIFYKFASANYDVCIRINIIEDAKNKYKNTPNSVYADIIRESLLNCNVNTGEINIYAHPRENIDLSDVKCATVHICKKITYSINCYCVDVVTYRKYYSCPNVYFEAVCVSRGVEAPIRGIKKVYVQYFALQFLRYYMPDTSILYCQGINFAAAETTCFLSQHILCYVSDDYICVNIGHEDYDLLSYYFSTLNANFGEIINSKSSSFEIIKTKIGHQLIADIDLNSGALIKNAYKI